MFTFMIILFKKRWNIDIINIDKVKNIFKAKRIKKTLSKDEKYLEKIKINTFDGSGSTTHPYILHFNNPFHGYEYYLTHTPYDDHNVALENPSLCVSHNGINFLKRKETLDPLLPIIKRTEKKHLKFYNDSFMFYEKNELQIWYRYTEEDKTSETLKAKSRIYRIVSKDGINFSKPNLIIDYSNIWYLSPSIVKIKDLYYLYYFDQDYRLYTRTSKNLKDWNSPKLINIQNFDGDLWHGEVKLIKNTLYLVFLSKDNNLYFCKTNLQNPLNFINYGKLQLYYYDKRNIYGNTHPYKSTFLISDQYIDLYIPFCINTIDYSMSRKIKCTKWTMTHTHLKLDHLSDLLC